ncbi:hypothetical protein HPB52_018000 [Rhipicephalus sanguineus]|uniref:HMG box domain-containing protein n=1 Tax=Rhipicephalus sanguineus TaxID=34632 RepID=A0A9D4YQG1_RHISA|nr:hypothetical protein HPB52_018000 [Rhipicephalus sanguineus]
MIFLQEKRRPVAAENPNENNHRVSSRLGRLCRTLSAAVEGPCQRKVAESEEGGHRRKHPDCISNPRECL